MVMLVVVVVIVIVQRAKNDVTQKRLRSTYVIHVTFEVAAHGLFDERANHQGAVTVADGTCTNIQNEVGCSRLPIQYCTVLKSPCQRKLY